MQNINIVLLIIINCKINHNRLYKLGDVPESVAPIIFIPKIGGILGVSSSDP